MERGTLYQLRNLMNRRNVTKEAKSDVNANEDFLQICFTGYILAAVMSALGMEDIDGSPLASIVSPDSWMEDESVRRSVLTRIASEIVDTHIDLKSEFHMQSELPATPANQPCTNPSSTVYEYTKEVLSLGLLYLNFKDAVREGDGERVLRMWKYFLLLFRATKHTNYAMEALTLLTQCFVTLPENLAEQIKWSRFINVHGQLGRNISCDLHMEHLNRVAKTAIDGLGANKTEQAIVRIGRCVGKIVSVLENFDKQTGVSEVSGSHSKKSITKDLHQVVEQLRSANVFDTTHMHKSFGKIKSNLIRTISLEDLKEWIIANYSKESVCR